MFRYGLSARSPFRLNTQSRLLLNKKFSFVSTRLNQQQQSIVNDNKNLAEDEDEYYVDVSSIDKRWSSLTFEAQQDIISYLNVKQEFGWNYLSKDEKKAIFYIAYGKWGPRDSSVLTGPEFVFKLMTNMLLFSVLGFSILNYAIDQEKIAEMTGQEQV